jgi:integrase
MPRKFPRRTLAKGIYRDADRIELRVMVNGVSHSEWIPGDTLLDEARRKWKQLQGRAQGHSDKPAKGSLAIDAERYLKLQTHLVSYRSRRAILKHWVDRLGHTLRHRITSEDVLEARVIWLANGSAAKTVNHRVSVLHHLYKTLDGRKADTPCDDVKPLPVQKTPIRYVPESVMLAVDAELQAREQRPGKEGRKFDGAKTRARFRVLATTGKRPSELMRAKPGDVDLGQCVWLVRDGKGGWSPPLWLNTDMLVAWALFIDANAWGRFNISSFGDTLRRAGWPKDIRLYATRNSTWIEATERGGDMHDIQVAAGHTDIKTTRGYTGIRNSRMRKLSELLDGRFGGFSVVPGSGPDDK